MNIDSNPAADVLALFHPVIQEWFRSRFHGPTEPQQLGWPHIAAGEHTLISAPTGSGKTLTAFLAVIDRLFREAVAGELQPELQVVYVSPLRALSNDMQRNLQGPLQEIQELAQAWGIDATAIRTGLRTGDSTSSQRAQILKRPPQILVTTPESLYLMLTAERGREVLRTVRHVIVDEIHALVRDKRGSHLSLSLERLQALVGRPLQRIGLSATQKPIERMGEFLVGSPSADDDEAATTAPRCRVVDVGHVRELDLGIEIPPTELQAVCSHDQWGLVNERLVELINSHRSTLIFVNTRRLAERLTHQLSQLLGEEQISSHHGSLSKEIRLKTEQQLKNGELKAVVATSSLELGIDVGFIDLVIQIGSPRAISAFLQRIGRSGHALGLIPKGRLVALTRDELVECMALLRAIRGRRLDVTPIPEAPLDILAQQIVAEVAVEEWQVDDLFAMVRRAWPYRQLTRERFEQTLKMLSRGLTENAEHSQTFIHYDQVQGRIRGRRNARITALSNGGAIGEVDTVRVVLDDENTVVGSVDEEFAVESMSGDIFLLGNSSWRIQRLRGNDLLVADAQGAPPTIPFWRGEAPGRTIELSEEISRLREELEQRLIAAEQASSPISDEVPGVPGGSALVQFLIEETCCSHFAAVQTVVYLAAQRAALGLVPTQNRVVFERFFDESGGMQLVVHAPFGGRINRGWGLAFRKRFCRSFDFELQATADDDGFILSLGPQHSFPIESLFPMMRTDNVRNLLEQALLVVPMFHLRWRWNVTRSLFVARMRNSKKVPPALQRFRSEDTLTAVFPKLTGCQENIVGDHEIPDHPLVQQTMQDCLFEALDIEGLSGVLQKIEMGEITLVGRDTREPSPFAYELLNANPYAFLDGGEAQERRARAVATRRSLSVEGVEDLGRLDPRAIAEVIAEAAPDLRDADELHDVLVSRMLLPVATDSAVGGDAVPHCWLQEKEFAAHLQSLCEAGRAVRITRLRTALAPDDAAESSTASPCGFEAAWIATECWTAIRCLYPEIQLTEEIQLPPHLQREWNEVESLVTLLRGWLETSGPITALDLSAILGIPVNRIFASLEAIEGEGLVLRGRFTPGKEAVDSDSPGIEWCHRRLLARIHRRTISGLRQEIEAVPPEVYLEFLARHQGAVPGYRKEGSDGLHEVISQLQGIDIPAGAWEPHLLAVRLKDYQPQWLDELSLSGEVSWARLDAPGKRKSTGRPMAAMTRAIPVSLFLRSDAHWLMVKSPERCRDELSASAQEILELLESDGALFGSDLQQRLRQLPSQLEDLLGELASSGWITADGFAGLRQLIRADQASHPAGLPSRFRRTRQATAGMGRWNVVPRIPCELTADEIAEEWAWQLLRRWGVVFRELAIREPLAPPWWQLLRIYRRLEARGELRGGRFIRGVGGEQFALSDAIRELRGIRQSTDRSQLVVISAADPLNLTGVIGGDVRIPALAAHQIAYLAGKVVGWKKGDDSWLSPDLTSEDRERLIREWGLERRQPLRPVTLILTPLTLNSDGTRVVDASGQSSVDEVDALVSDVPADAPPVQVPRPRRRQQSSKSIPRPFPF
ncbi:DEAD/DEAH box helicase [Planctomicrobium sp. SH664]|uniref:DEAD/DEAH box helicase n=1 Tax=Planctomicrobium sp. SH664 TaxID=3448125 RepID=UPI003F5BA679